jgi:WD40 repeat protein
LGLAFSPDGKLLATGEGKGKVRLWCPDTGRNLTTLSGHAYLIYSLAFSPDGKWLVSGSMDSTVSTKVWEVATGRERARIETRNLRSIHGVAFSPDGRYLATGDTKGNVTLIRFRAISE